MVQILYLFSVLKYMSHWYDSFVDSIAYIQIKKKAINLIVSIHIYHQAFENNVFLIAVEYIH